MRCLGRDPQPSTRRTVCCGPVAASHNQHRERSGQCGTRERAVAPGVTPSPRWLRNGIVNDSPQEMPKQ